MEYEAFRSWVEAYGRSWETRDADAFAALFAADATYHEVPFGEPMRGRAAIRDYAAEAGRTQEGIGFEYELLAVAGNKGISRWRAAFTRVPARTRVQLDGILVAAFDSAGRCSEFREWWHRLESPPVNED